MNIENWRYEDFVSANDGKFSVLDFIHAVTRNVAFPQDFSVCIGHLFAPQMIIFDRVIVAAEWFDEARYQEYRSRGMRSDQAQAWINMVELTDIFQGISFEKAKELAALIAGLWDDRIRRNFPNETIKASVIADEESNEVFVTIGEFLDVEPV
ncbi:hypothetical protein [Paraburkholderia bannensis]|uniref:hypothetical protein n=1 Tax=Paraburkholderia bannensis TaxID=765414 RepID=UPI002AB67450|nr:hypothetical protein [Paraburkholderia bannensis]